MPPRFRFAPFRSLVFSRPAALVAALLTTIIVVGCMSLNLNTDDPSILVQTNSIEVQAGQELEVFYAAPYAGPPNLVIDDWHNDCVVTEQKENRFRVKNNNATWVRTVRWTARGQRAPTPVRDATTRPPFAKDEAPAVQEGPPPPAKIGTPRELEP